MRKWILVFLLLIGMRGMGQVMFQKTYGGTGDDYGQCVLQTTDGGYIISGTTKSFGTGNDDYYLIKTNAIGDTLWTRTYGTFNNEQECFVSQTNDGGYIISGNSYDTTGQCNFYLIKANSNGDTLWTKNIFIFTL